MNYRLSADITNKFDALGRLTNMVDATVTTVYSYDGVGQVLSEDGPWADDVMSHVYANRLRSSMSIAEQYSPAWSPSYDSARRLSSVTSPAGTFDMNNKDHMKKLSNCLKEYTKFEQGYMDKTSQPPSMAEMAIFMTECMAKQSLIWPPK